MNDHDPALAALTIEQRRNVWEIAALLDAALLDAALLNPAQDDPRDVPVDELDAAQEADR